MITLLYLLHFAVCIAIIVIVLLQADKGSGLAGAFGGGGAYAKFGDEGGFDMMGKITTGVAALFMVLSLVISVYTKKHAQELAMQKAIKNQAIQQQIPAKLPLNTPPVKGKVPSSETK